MEWDGMKWVGPEPELGFKTCLSSSSSTTFSSSTSSAYGHQPRSGRNKN